MPRLKKRRIRRYRPSASALAVRRLPRPRVEIDRGQAWYVLWTAPRAEKCIESMLREAGLATYLPIEAFATTKRGREIEVERPALGRYLFVGLHGAHPQWSEVHKALEGQSGWMTGIPVLGRVLMVAGQALRVPAGALQVLADGLSLAGQMDTQKASLASGRACKAISGPFAGFFGIVEASDDCRVRALLDVFGRRTVVEFKPDQLEAA